MVYETGECDIRIPDFHRLSQVDRLSKRPPGSGASHMETFVVLFKTFVTLLFNMNSIYQRLSVTINFNYYFGYSCINLHGLFTTYYEHVLI